MKVCINNIPLRIYNGGKVKDALLRYQVHCGLAFEKGSYLIYDKYGNEVEHDGALSENSELFLELKPIK